MPYRLYLPDAAKGGRRYPSLYLLHGLFGSFDNWCELAGFESAIAGREMIVVMPEGENGWYSDGGSARYEQYIVRDLIEHCDAAYPTKKSGKKRAVAGNSMGGYGAVKFALKYPELFDFAYSTSGAFAVTSWSDENPPTLWEEYRPSVTEVFGEPESEIRRANDILMIAADADAATLPMLYLDCGRDDDFCETNIHIAAEFEKLGIDHEFAVNSGGHDWDYWSQMLIKILKIADKRFCLT
jgi:S-formylglutathione hydrolase FrmB